ncbi:hypothetical protein PC41400_14745 [Paenibacillus chitinolyticus]|uniref:Uncharacterized protein n=1 Tax=Paenibacillus chitinolyticus TaxID=79263 RepID=A0A410WX64_9BACL|nr:hypothetical protein [Paenibacillus chitinolyticus]MCY9593969.1 hypothetical protein [Paenibacillus chitinolyticus]MCY9599624.1 hypothetical protein [Paenibacillus chitinolyticus]QAV18867.1 hypothetical protein PC41400_14745 [Paenibacillus chitinolyticus]
MDDNIIRFPVGFYQRKKNELGAKALICEVSPRWMEIVNTSHEKDFIANVMTLGADKKEKKLCELVLLKEDIYKLAELLKTDKT